MGLKVDVKGAWKFAKDTGLLKEAEDFLWGQIRNKKEDLEEYQQMLDGMDEKEIEETFIPDVYQKDIYSIDYEKLKANGITLISFDIDDTIADSIIDKVTCGIPFARIPMPDEAKELFAKLKEMGFTVTLLTNAREKMGREVCQILGADGYIAKAHKPETKSFEEMMETYNCHSTQMAHVGNDICKDVMGGNRAHVTTCLVRRAGFTLKGVKMAGKAVNIGTKGDLVRAKLEGKWRKHHKYYHGDQYYQLGETPEYKKGGMEVPVAVVCDGKAPMITARNIKAYVENMGCEACLMDADEYKEKIKSGSRVRFGKVLIVGHHDLAKEQMAEIGAEYSDHGMMFGISEEKCVLWASRSLLGKGKKGREIFRRYYNTKIQEFQKEAEKNGIPMEFGHRKETRQSQYDLLWLMFAEYRLLWFLGKGMHVWDREKELDSVQQAVNNLIEKINADKEEAFSLDELLRESRLQKESSGMETLRTHLGEDISFTGIWGGVEEIRELDEDELLEGEVFAHVSKVGCYSVRMAGRLYKDCDSVCYEDRIPLGRAGVEAYKEGNIGKDEYRDVIEISARYDGGGKEGSGIWQHICLAATSMSWSEGIDFICAVKRNGSSDREASLFVLKTYTGNSYSVEHWYRLAPDGETEEYQIHPLDEDSWKEPWTL